MFFVLVSLRLYFILVASHGASLGYGVYGTTDDNSTNRKLHHINKSHQQISNTGQMENTRPIEEMPYQVMIS